MSLTLNPRFPLLPSISMAPRLLLLPFLLLFLLSSITTASSPNKKKLKEKLSHLHFYFHDVVGGRNATAVPVTKPAGVGQPFSAFGVITIMDDLLTEGPDPKSEQVGRAQGMYTGAAQEELGFLMAMNLAFTAGKYNGSVLSVLGRNPPLHPVREMPIVGGSGLFRFARGYALARTIWFNFTTGDAIVEYDVHVMHY
ncbi:dirigent protein 22-like [Dendrobium catenatum]|uniref:Dirigent protein n=1 Tax=Dendrobium catenatum TaxID=906689 RepID=A0A2I0W4E4_9ASPA|nr:dirigent protein 22-like [Dendrobium catenatum]PKU70533.1 Disease resistance response protein 206 [Dendrobium catenatum]